MLIARCVPTHLPRRLAESWPLPCPKVSRGCRMLKGVHLTLLVGPVVPVPVPQVVLDALTQIEVVTPDEAAGAFTLSFTLSVQSPLQTLFLLSGGSVVPLLRVIVVVTVNGTPQVLIDGVVTKTEITPGADQRHTNL